MDLQPLGHSWVATHAVVSFFPFVFTVDPCVMLPTYQNLFNIIHDLQGQTLEPSDIHNNIKRNNDGTATAGSKHWSRGQAGKGKTKDHS
eukprot:1490186-Amphidinium_carterae.2